MLIILQIIIGSKIRTLLVCFAALDSGKVYTFGESTNGQLGHGNLAEDTYDPTIINWSSPTKVVQVSCGEGHTAVLSGTDRKVL